jgi:hypothetical protein
MQLDIIPVDWRAMEDAEEGVLQELGIAIERIEKGKPWQNLIEAQFKVERRLADAAFERAATLEEIHAESRGEMGAPA